MYVVKVGEYYVSEWKMGNVILSQERMLTFPQETAVFLAKRLSGKIISFNVVGDIVE